MNKFFTLLQNIILKLNSKADIVDGKIPASQLPDDIGGLTEVSWEDIKDKPFEEQKAFDDIVWNDNVDGLPSVSTSVRDEYETIDITWYKISDKVLSIDDVIGGSIAYNVIDDGIYEEEINDDIIYQITESGSFMYDAYMICIAKAGDVVPSDISGVEIVFPDEGIWVGRVSVDGEIVERFEHLKSPTKITKIDEKYLPEVLPEVTMSDSGKILKVNNQGTWVADKVDIDVLPEVTTSDSGKFLRVNDQGAWVADSVPNAEGVAF